MKARFPHPGEVFEEKYKVEAILGSGGFARVYRAVELGLDRKVALKILRPRIDDDQSHSERDSYLETVMQRFQREARMLSQLRASNTITMHHYGKTDGGLLYMVLEYIDGLSLAELMRAGKPLPPKRVATIVEQVLKSLHEAHLMGMLHRDLKPANIMIYEHLGNRDNVKLLDFGIAKLVKDANVDKDLTGDGTLVGTPRYMAPEQIRGERDVGPGADVYSLGLVAYELLVGERAIEADSSIKIIGRQLSPESFFLPVEIDCPPRLRHIVDKMLQKDPNIRYQSAEEVIRALSDPELLSNEIAEIDEIALAPIEAVDDLLAGDFEPLDLDDPSVEEVGPSSLEVSKAAYLANPDVSVEEPFPGDIDPSYTGEESIDTSFSGLTADRRRPIILAGAVFLALVLSLLALVFFGGDEEEIAHAETKSPATTASQEPDAGENTGALAANEAPDAGEEAPDPEFIMGDPVPMMTVIMSNQEGVEVFIDGELVGTAPVEVERSTFPANLEARHKGRVQKMDIKEPVDQLMIPFAAYVPPEPKAERPKSKPKKKKYRAILP